MATTLKKQPVDQAMDLTDIADYLKISERTAWQLCREGKLPAKQVGRQWRSTREQLNAYLTK